MEGGVPTCKLLVFDQRGSDPKGLVKATNGVLPLQT
jgi:hypothetical protein